MPEAQIQRCSGFHGLPTCHHWSALDRFGALNKDVMGQSHSSLSCYITNHSKRVRFLFSSFIYKLRHSSLVNVETVPRCGFSTSTTVNKHVLTWLGGGGGWRSKRFPVIVAQRRWYSASTSWHYACTISQATQQARGRRFVGTLAWSTYKRCFVTVAQWSVKHASSITQRGQHSTLSCDYLSGINVGLSRRMATFKLRLTYLINKHLSLWSVR